MHISYIHLYISIGMYANKSDLTHIGAQDCIMCYLYIDVFRQQ